jgi:ABC-type multidrug transport system fused ATPase/permease subunit
VGGLEAEAEWSHVLSLGEQQRVAFLRLLLHAPKLAFLDEATGALDSATEAALYTALQRHCSSYVSVGANTLWSAASAAAALWLPALAPADLCITPTVAMPAAADAALGVSFTLEHIIMRSMAHG